MSPTISTSADALARFRLRSFIVCPRDDSANYIRLFIPAEDCYWENSARLPRKVFRRTSVNFMFLIAQYPLMIQSSARLIPRYTL